jgi:hypothetical protein
MSGEVGTDRRRLVTEGDRVEAPKDRVHEGPSLPERLDGEPPRAAADVPSPLAPDAGNAARPRMWLSIVAGLLTAVAVLVLGALFASSRPAQWTAESQYLMGPPTNADRARIAAYYETLSRGQVVSTAAEITGELRFQVAAATDLGLPTRDDVSVRAAVVPGTALVSVTATGRNRDQVEKMPDAVIEQASPTINTLLSPYRVNPLGSAAGTARQTGLSQGQFVAVLALVAVVAGAAVQQVVQHLSAARRQRIPQQRS